MATERELERAAQVRRWLEDPLFQQIFDDLRQLQFERIENSAAAAQNERERAYNMLNVITLFKQQLEQIASATAHARASEATRTLMQ